MDILAETVLRLRLFLQEEYGSRRAYVKLLSYNYDNIGVRRCQQDLTVVEMLNAFFVDNYGKPCPPLVLSIFTSGSPSLVSKVSSFLNTLAKMTFSKIYTIRDWIPLVDIQTCIGFPKAKDRVFSDDVKEWLGGIVEEELDVDDIEARIAKSILLPVCRPPIEPFDSWLSRRQNWVGPGSMRDSELVVDGVPNKTKLGFAMSASAREVERSASIEAAMSEGLRAFVKPDERGIKGRYIISAPFATFVRMKYISDRLEALARFDPRMNLFRRNGQTPAEIMRRLRDREALVPMDFSAFDYHISAKFWVAWFNFLRKQLPECIDIIDSLSDLLGRIPVYDAEGERVCVWRKGMPSGFYWTAMLDSLFNMIACDIAFEGTQYDCLIVQGDDVVVRSKGEVDLSQISTLISKTGMVVNVQKNWFTQGICEFLKVVYTANEAFQYPARAYATVIWAYPAFNVEPSERLANLTSAWKEYFDRTPVWDEVRVIRDLHRATAKHFSWSQRSVEEWLHTAPSLGGFGLHPVRFNWRFKMLSEKVRLRVSGSRFPHYPFFKSVNMGMKRIKVTGSYIVHTPNTPPPRLDRIKPLPTWQEYIQYVRAINGLQNSLFAERVVVRSNVPKLRVKHWSDAASSSVFGKTELFVVRLGLKYTAHFTSVLASFPFKSLLWK